MYLLSTQAKIGRWWFYLKNNAILLGFVYIFICKLSIFIFVLYDFDSVTATRGQTENKLLLSTDPDRLENHWVLLLSSYTIFMMHKSHSRRIADVNSLYINAIYTVFTLNGVAEKRTNKTRIAQLFERKHKAIFHFKVHGSGCRYVWQIFVVSWKKF